jgi:hypothetical protein
MGQTDEDEVLVKTLVRMIEEKRLKVHIYTKDSRWTCLIASATQEAVRSTEHSTR